MPTDGHIAKFLYTILKQLDLKTVNKSREETSEAPLTLLQQIDWQAVAGQLDITNGHAARMRFSRFKQQMEGVPVSPRKPRATAPRQKRAKPDKPDKSASAEKEAKQEPQLDPQPSVKAESGDALEPMEGVEPTVKVETIIKSEPGIIPEPVVKAEPVVKEELRDGDSGIWLSTGSQEARGGDWASLKPPHSSPQSVVEAGAEDAGNAEQRSLGLVPMKTEPIVKMETSWED